MVKVNLKRVKQKDMKEGMSYALINNVWFERTLIAEEED